MAGLKGLKNWFITNGMNGLQMWSPRKIKEKGSGTLAILALIIICIVWGTTWVASKQGVMHMSAIQLSGIRLIIGGSIFLVYFTIKRMPFPQKKDLIPLLILAVLNFVMSNGLSTWGVKYLSSGMAAIMGAIFPLWIVLIGLLANKTAPPKGAILGLLIGFFGVCSIFYEHLSDFLLPDFRFGIFLSLVASVSWALGTIYTKKHAKIFNPYFGLGFQMLVAGTILYGLSSFGDAYLPIRMIPSTAWFAIFYLVIFGSLIGFVLYLYALQHLPTEQVATYAYINPIIALIVAWLLFSEPISAGIVIGGAITIFGVFIVNRSYRGK